MKVSEFLQSKIGYYNSTHPFNEKVDYEDIEKWLEEYGDLRYEAGREAQRDIQASEII